MNDIKMQVCCFERKLNILGIISIDRIVKIMHFKEPANRSFGMQVFMLNIMLH